jgi:ribosomal peptide maturation radical SAM protein 1
MRIALVAMPWAEVQKPAPALGMLTAAVRQRCPEHTLECQFPYIYVAAELGVDLYTEIGTRKCSEMLSCAQLYPDKRSSVEDYFVETAASFEGLTGSSDESRRKLFDHIMVALERSVARTVTELAQNYDVVGFTTTSNQLFASLVVAQRLQEADSDVNVVFGGTGVSEGMGPAVLREYPFVDYVVQGDGEHQFVELLRQLEEPDHEVPARPEERLRPGNEKPVASVVVPDLNELPYPDFDRFPEIAEQELAVDWLLPIEGSRGCWWDRVDRTGDPMDICHFCSEAGKVYREKTADRIADEMEALADRYSVARFMFCDLVTRAKGIGEMARAIQRKGRRFEFYTELRAQLSSYEIMLLWQAGLRFVTIGIEGFSSAYLERLGKGTRTIQNLQAMKTCWELGIDSESAIITDFPQAPQSEADETARNMLDYAIGYQPVDLNRFGLQRNTSVYSRPELFGVTNVRNDETYKVALPEEIWRRLELRVLSFDTVGAAADWSGVREALKTWRELHRRIRMETKSGMQPTFFIPAPLYYKDRDAYLDIIDRRDGFSVIRLDGLWRAVYMYCMQIRTQAALRRQFASSSEQQLDDVLADFVGQKLMFVEKGKCLSLAVATDPHTAAARIQAEHERHRPVAATA